MLLTFITLGFLGISDIILFCLVHNWGVSKAVHVPQGLVPCAKWVDCQSPKSPVNEIFPSKSNLEITSYSYTIWILGELYQTRICDVRKNGPNAIHTFSLLRWTVMTEVLPTVFLDLFRIVKPPTFNHLTVDWPSNPQKLLVMKLLCATSLEPFIPTATARKISTFILYAWLWVYKMLDLGRFISCNKSPIGLLTPCNILFYVFVRQVDALASPRRVCWKRSF